MLALAEHPDRGGPARRCAERDHHQRRRRGGRAAAPRRPGPQALLHRLHRGRPACCSSSARTGAAVLHGARRQRPVHRLRRRRPRRWPSRAPCRPRCATSARPAPPPTGSTSTPASPTSSPAGSPSAWAPWRVGRGTEPGVEVGPLIDEAGRQQGRRRWSATPSTAAPRSSTGGKAVDGAGYFYPPTVLDRRAPRRPDAARGDLRPGGADHLPSTTEDEAVAAANDTEYGLVAYLFTEDLDRALRRRERLETGMVGLNTGRRLQPGRAVRRREAVRARPGGRARRHRRVPRDPLPGDATALISPTPADAPRLTRPAHPTGPPGSSNRVRTPAAHVLENHHGPLHRDLA